MADLGKDFESEHDLGKEFEAEGGAEGGAEGPSKPVPEPVRTGTVGDAAKSFANAMTFGAAPQLEGVIGAVAKQAVEGPKASNKDILDAYRSVRDAGKKEHADAEDTIAGTAGNVAGILAPHPLLPSPAPGASIPKRMLQSGAVGAGVGAISGGANSSADLTSGKLADYEKLLLDAGKGGFAGGLTSAALGGGMAAAEGPLRRTAEVQALKAAGLEGGIKNAPRAMGLKNEADARELGRGFLQAKLIPWAGSKESVANRATDLNDFAGESVGEALKAGQKSGVPANAKAVADAMRGTITSPTTSTVAEMASGPTMKLADAVEQQGVKTPGNWGMLNKAKSDAWKSANLDPEAPIAKQLYRQATGAGAGEIENQLRAVNPTAADVLKAGNKAYGVSKDALDLADKSGLRSIARNTLSLSDYLSLLAGTGGAAAAGTGHGGLGATAIGSVLAHHWLKNHGNALAARGADALANRMSENTGGHVGGMAGSKWEQLLEKKKDEDK